MTADRIRLTGLRGTGYHGVLPHERRDGQPFVVDVELRLSTREAADADDLALTVDYGSVAKDVVAMIEGPPLALIETLAQRIARACLDRETVSSVLVTVHKPSAPIDVPFADVSVTIERS